jgi:hypothetical protein
VGLTGVLSYDGRRFRSAARETADQAGSGPVGHYHQAGSVVWAEFAGGRVVRGSLVGSCDPEGVLSLAYCQLLSDGSVLAGRCTSIPTVLDDGRVRLREHWERFGAHAATGVSVIEEIPAGPDQQPDSKQPDSEQPDPEQPDSQQPQSAGQPTAWRRPEGRS